MNAGGGSLGRDLARSNESGPQLKATELYVSHQQLPVALTLTWQHTNPPPPPNFDSLPHNYKDSLGASSTSAAWVNICAGQPLVLGNYKCSRVSLTAVTYMIIIHEHTRFIFLFSSTSSTTEKLGLLQFFLKVLRNGQRALLSRAQGRLTSIWAAMILCHRRKRNISKRSILVNFYFTKCIYRYVYGHVLYQNKCSPKEIWTPLQYV